MKTENIPDIFLEQYLLEELPGDIRNDIDNRLKNDPKLKERLDNLKKSDKEILALYPTEIIIREINARVRKPEPVKSQVPDRGIFRKFFTPLKSPQRFTYALSGALVIVMLFIFITGLFKIDLPLTEQNGGERIKGLESKLILYRVRGSEISELNNLSRVKKGDIIQAAYIASDSYRYAMVISIDGRGTVTEHFPDNNGKGGMVEQNRKVMLNRSYELDDSPSYERFILLLSPEAIDTHTVIQKAKKLAKSGSNAEYGLLEAGNNITEYSILLKKGE